MVNTRGIVPKIDAKEYSDTAPIGALQKGYSIPPCKRTRAAAFILKWSDSNSCMTTSKAMVYAGFTEEESKNTALQRRVQRYRRTLEKGEQEVPVPAPPPVPAPAPVSVVSIKEGGSTVFSSLTVSAPEYCKNCINNVTTFCGNCNSNTTSVTRKKRKQEPPLETLTNVDVDHVAAAAVALASVGGSQEEPNSIALTKRRRTAKQKQYDMARRQQEDEQRDHAYQAAYVMMKEQQGGTKKLSADKVCTLVNNLYGTSISHKTLLRRMRGDSDFLPPRIGRKPTLPNDVESNLVAAMSSFIILRCAEMKEQPNRQDLVKRLATAVKASPTPLTDHVSLFKRLEKKYATDVAVDSGDNRIEERRALWGTFNHINDWFDTQKQWFIDFKFARVPTKYELATGFKGELFFFDGQLDRILNLDETGISLDGTSQMAGGQPVTRYGPGNKRLPVGVQRANKSNYKCTFIGGSTVAGDPLPPHFQLKCTAKDEADRKISTNFLKRENIPEFYGRFGFDQVTARGLTVNSNPTAGMDSVEFNKYMETAIVPLYPDAKDVDGKRVCVMVDSGPGRMSETFLCSMRKRGFYIVVSVPNTTHIMQPTDKSYGLFKSTYRNNLKELTVWRRARKQTLKPSDIMLLIFGGTIDSKTKLRHCFHEAFSVEKSKKVWEDVGLFPFTRKCLNDTKVAHELIVLPDGTIDVDADPLTYELIKLEEKNRAAVEYLNRMGFDGEVFRQAAPRNHQNMRRKMTVPNTRDRQDEIEKANTSGQLYIATKGLAVNSNDFFLAKERSRRKIVLADMVAKKKKAAADSKKKEAALALIAKCEEDNKDVTQLSVASLRVVLEWKTGKKTTGFKKKVDLIDLWNSIKDDPPCSSVVWTQDEEDLLKELETKEIEMKDTLLGKETGKMVKQNLSYLENFSEEQAKIADVPKEEILIIKQMQALAVKLRAQQATLQQVAELRNV